MPGEGHRRRDGLAPRAFEELREHRRRRCGQARVAADPGRRGSRKRPAERLPGAPAGTRARASRPAGGSTAGARRRAPRRGSRRAGTGGRGAGAAGRAVIFLIWWVALRASISGPSVQPFTVFARIAVGRAGLLGRHLVGGVQLAVVVATAGELLQLGVGEVLDHLAQAGVRAEEVLPDVGAGLRGETLEVAVGRRVHLVDEHAVDVAGEQLVPLAAPDDLDDVPAAAAEQRLAAPG